MNPLDGKIVASLKPVASLNQRSSLAKLFKQMTGLHHWNVITLNVCSADGTLGSHGPINPKPALDSERFKKSARRAPKSILSIANLLYPPRDLLGALINLSLWDLPAR